MNLDKVDEEEAIYIDNSGSMNKLSPDKIENPEKIEKNLINMNNNNSSKITNQSNKNGPQNNIRKKWDQK